MPLLHQSGLVPHEVCKAEARNKTSPVPDIPISALRTEVGPQVLVEDEESPARHGHPWWGVERAGLT